MILVKYTFLFFIFFCTSCATRNLFVNEDSSKDNLCSDNIINEHILAQVCIVDSGYLISLYKIDTLYTVDSLFLEEEILDSLPFSRTSAGIDGSIINAKIQIGEVLFISCQQSPDKSIAKTKGRRRR